MAEEASAGQKVQQACCLCCLGFLVFPLTLLSLGWNEKNFVCTQKNILLADKDSVVTGCSDTPGDDQFISLQCNLDKTKFTEFTMSSFDAEPKEPAANPFGNILRFSSVSGEMSGAEMYVCKEESHPEKVDSSCQDTKDKKCPTHTVYTYKEKWEDKEQPTMSGLAAHDVEERKRVCPGLRGHTNPALPSNLKWTPRFLKPEADVKLEGNFYVTPETGAAHFTATAPISQELAAAKATFAQNTPKATSGVNAVFDAKSVVVVGNHLQTCGESPVLGCVRVSFRKNGVAGVSVIANSGMNGRLAKQKMPASWGCGRSSYSELQMRKMTKDDVIDAAHASNESQLYFLRVVGFLACWAAVYCCLYPIVAFFDIMEDGLRMVPCFGPCLSVIGNIVETLAQIVVCCMSCSFGCSAAMFTVAIVWLYMRPLQGLLYMAICIVLSGGAYMLAHMAPKKSVEARDLSTELSGPSQP